jgi:hypothetical protein
MVLRLLDTGAEAVEEVDGIDAIEAVQAGRYSQLYCHCSDPACCLLLPANTCAARHHARCILIGLTTCPHVFLHAVQYGAAPPALQQMAAQLVNRYFGADNEP